MSYDRKTPVIVTLDIETAPLQSYHWGLWDENVGLEQIQNEWTILAFAAKRLGQVHTTYADTGGRGARRVRDDKPLLAALWQVLDAADIVVTQNGKAFDLKKINARLLMNGFPPYSPIRIIDTKLIAKRHFGFTSNKLAWMSQHLTDTPKSSHKRFPGFELWTECLKDNPKAWAEMRKYNIRDVEATEKLYLRLRPWTEGHPNVAAYGDMCKHQCPKCGSTRLQKRGESVTQAGRYHRFQCSECGGWSRARLALANLAQRRRLLT